MPKASIGIFQKNIDYDDMSVRPTVPNYLFEAAKRVSETKIQEIIKAKDGFFIIIPSETGPFNDPNVVNTEWMPVQIIRVKQWSSGGIKKKEMEDFLARE